MSKRLNKKQVELSRKNVQISNRSFSSSVIVCKPEASSSEKSSTAIEDVSYCVAGEKSLKDQYSNLKSDFRLQVAAFTVKKLFQLKQMPSSSSLLELASLFLRFVKPVDTVLSKTTLNTAVWEKFTKYISNPGHVLMVIRKLPLYMESGALKVPDIPSINLNTLAEPAESLYRILAVAHKMVCSLHNANYKPKGSVSLSCTVKCRFEDEFPEFARGAGVVEFNFDDQIDLSVSKTSHKAQFIQKFYGIHMIENKHNCKEEKAQTCRSKSSYNIAGNYKKKVDENKELARGLHRISEITTRSKTRMHLSKRK